MYFQGFFKDSRVQVLLRFPRVLNISVAYLAGVLGPGTIFINSRKPTSEGVPEKCVFCYNIPHSYTMQFFRTYGWKP